SRAGRTLWAAPPCTRARQRACSVLITEGDDPVAEYDRGRGGGPARRPRPGPVTTRPVARKARAGAHARKRGARSDGRLRLDNSDRGLPTPKGGGTLLVFGCVRVIDRSSERPVDTVSPWNVKIPWE